MIVFAYIDDFESKSSSSSSSEIAVVEDVDNVGTWALYHAYIWNYSRIYRSGTWRLKVRWADVDFNISSYDSFPMQPTNISYSTLQYSHLKVTPAYILCIMSLKPSTPSSPTTDYYKYCWRLSILLGGSKTNNWFKVNFFFFSNIS